MKVGVAVPGLENLGMAVRFPPGPLPQQGCPGRQQGEDNEHDPHDIVHSAGDDFARFLDRS